MTSLVNSGHLVVVDPSIENFLLQVSRHAQTTQIVRLLSIINLAASLPPSSHIFPRIGNQPGTDSHIYKRNLLRCGRAAVLTTNSLGRFVHRFHLSILRLSVKVFKYALAMRQPFEADRQCGSVEKQKSQDVLLGPQIALVCPTPCNHGVPSCCDGVPTL